MQLYKIRGGDQESLTQKKYNIGVGISLGNKWYTVDNIVAQVKWSLEYTNHHVIVYVADSIHAINIEIRKRVSHEKALKLSKQMGEDLLNDVKERIESTFSKEDIEKVHYATWDELVDENYIQKKNYLYSLYDSNDEFRDLIHGITRNHLSRDSKEFSDEDIHRLGTYIIEELPEVINRIPMKGLPCEAYVYPFDGDLTRMIEKIQKGELFPEIKKIIMDTQPKVFLEVR